MAGIRPAAASTAGYDYKRQVAVAGFDKLHGLRHAYAQERYSESTGRAASAAGGNSWKELTPQDKVEDHEARLTISREFGRGREQVTVVYLGNEFTWESEQT